MDIGGFSKANFTEMEIMDSTVKGGPEIKEILMALDDNKSKSNGSSSSSNSNNRDEDIPAELFVSIK